nr:twin-arginine translocase subunit TatC [Veillonella rogosae]
MSYYYVDVLLEILLKPAGKLYYMKPTEAFFTYMKVSIVGGAHYSSAYYTASDLALC